jgi:hypothetical protein
MMLSLVADSTLRGERRDRPRATPDRRRCTPVNAWLRQYGPLVGMALMALSAAAVVLSALILTGV